ncbi:MAG TPA: response regulator, partial [Gammaproteobacteria bacterium]|nr:response regulator [Gammaproteobacteria bacterium]
MSSTDHILVVDDDQEIRRLLGDYLTRNGYRVSTAGDGNEMRQVLAHSKPDLVVLDVMLPGTDGLELCRELRSQSTIPVIMLTARDEEMDRVIGLEMGADDYLAKP